MARPVVNACMCVGSAPTPLCAYSILVSGEWTTDGVGDATSFKMTSPVACDSGHTPVFIAQGNYQYTFNEIPGDHIGTVQNCYYEGQSLGSFNPQSYTFTIILPGLSEDLDDGIITFSLQNDGPCDINITDPSGMTTTVPGFGTYSAPGGTGFGTTDSPFTGTWIVTRTC